VFRILQEVDSGVPVVDAARKHGVSPATIHRWKTKYSGMTPSELKRLKASDNGPEFIARAVCQWLESSSCQALRGSPA
jgi:transposase-like protein